MTTITTEPRYHQLDSATSNDVLIGTGEREVKLGFVRIQVYTVGLYVDRRACRDCLLPEFGNVDHNGLLCHPSFYPAFVSGKFRKTFRLTFHRTLTQSKLVSAFADALASRCDDDHGDDAELLLSKLVPPSGVVENDVLTLICEGDEKTVKCTYNSVAADGDDEVELISFESGGEGGAWRALQNIYFDENTALPTIKQSVVSDLPNVLIRGEGKEEEEGEEEGKRTSGVKNDVREENEGEQKMRQPSAKEIEDAVEEQFSKGGTYKGKSLPKSWSEFAGRNPGEDGETGYKFGDLTLGIATTLGLRKAKKTSPGDGAEKGAVARTVSTENDPSLERQDKLALKMEKLEEELEAIKHHRKVLEIEKKDLLEHNRKLQRDLDHAEGTVAEARLTLPLNIMLALFVAELTEVASDVVLTTSTATKVSYLRLILLAIGSVAAYFYSQERLHCSGFIAVKTKVS